MNPEELFVDEEKNEEDVDEIFDADEYDLTER